MTFANIVNGFQKVLHRAYAIKMPIDSGNLNIRICRDVAGDMWFEIDELQK